MNRLPPEDARCLSMSALLSRERITAHPTAAIFSCVHLLRQDQGEVSGGRRHSHPSSAHIQLSFIKRHPKTPPEMITAALITRNEKHVGNSKQFFFLFFFFHRCSNSLGGARKSPTSGDLSRLFSGENKYVLHGSKLAASCCQLILQLKEICTVVLC